MFFKALLQRIMKRSNGRAVVVALEHGASGDDGIGSGVDDGFDGTGIYAAVDHQAHGPAARHALALPHFCPLGRQDPLAAHPWGD